jgi:hypothetical protein
VLANLKALTYEESQAIKGMETWANDEGEDLEVNVANYCKDMR